MVQAAEPGTRRLALVIGNADYTSIGALDNPASDARAIATRLADFGFELLGTDGTITSLPVIDASRRDFQRALFGFRRAVQAADPEIVLIYYAGHGMQNGRRSYLLPVDVPADDIELVLAESISLEDAIDGLDRHAGLTVAIFDACREIPSNSYRPTTRCRKYLRYPTRGHRSLEGPRPNPVRTCRRGLGRDGRP